MSVIDSSEKSSAISTKRLAVFTIITVGIIYGLVCLLSGQNFISMSSASAGILPSNLKTQTSDALRNALKAIPALPNLEKRMNILVMGVDWNGDEAERFAGTRSDTMMLVSLDPVRKKVGIVSIPRDSRVEIARGHGFNKINSAHALGGPILACQTVADNFSVNVDHYLVVDTAGLTKIFELLGPFEVVVEKEMLYKDETAHLDIDLKPGRQLLDPRQTVGYLRFRHDATADIGRIERQQWFLRQALAKTQDPMILLKAPQIIQAGLECISTDMRSEDIASLLS
ncbi:MAG: LCP family protein, partial [Candidatus Obscuribacterales bacterium]|nr:LCP family protein [Candidatus Obscuribacterales bacterium]